MDVSDKSRTLGIAIFIAVGMFSTIAANKSSFEINTAPGCSVGIDVIRNDKKKTFSTGKLTAEATAILKPTARPRINLIF